MPRRNSTEKVAPKSESTAGDGLLWPEGVKHCNKCDSDKPRSDFASNKSAKDHAYHMCKACESEYNRIRREAKAAVAPAKPKAAAAALAAPAAKAPKGDLTSSRLPGQTFNTAADLKVAIDALNAAEAEAALVAEVPASPAPKAKRSRKPAAEATAPEEAVKA